ncbi:MAG: ABC transporter ATP-binding protein [Patescibacteria group bacterium]|nr:ABC transporter ATP-binding protein [Patescibacteria group bacterium]
MENNVLDVKKLSKKFGSPPNEFIALDNVSFSIKDGEILGLLGPNGAGKTTTIQMLLGVMDPSFGEINYFGKNFKKNREETLKKINFSSTYISLPWSLTVSEILEIFARLYEIPDRKRRVEKLLNDFEIESLKKKQFYMLSAGEKTRLLLTKAFLNYPRIILLDEPTASLDVEIAVKVRKFLKIQQREYKVSMLFTSHNMSEVEEMCDRVIILNHGKIIAEDTPENLANTISDTEVELLIKKDAQKAIALFKKIEIPFEQDRFSFKIIIDEKRVAEFLILLAEEKIGYEEISINKSDLEDYFMQTIERNNYNV